jgi:hypothetical protein
MIGVPPENHIVVPSDCAGDRPRSLLGLLTRELGVPGMRSEGELSADLYDVLGCREEAICGALYICGPLCS